MTEADLMEYLDSQFGKNEPIFLDEIESSEVKKYFLKSVENLIHQGLIKEYSKDVYYIPTTTPLGLSTLSSTKVYEKKYLSNKVSVMGYYSGNKLLNLMGLSTQVPNIIQITTNNAVDDLQLIKEGNTSLELKKPVVEVTRENVYTLQFIEAMLMLFRTNNRIKDDNIKEIFRKYIINHKIIKNEFIKYVSFYPEDVRNVLYGSGLINGFIK